MSDSHGFLDDRMINFFKDCDEIWHAGDIGTIETSDKLSEIKPFRAVYGNIDNDLIRKQYPKILRFQIEDLNIMITHIGGYPQKYTPEMKAEINQNPPDLLIVGHSHILRIMYDKQHQFLFINPGASGNSGFHTVKTAVRFTIDKKEIKNMEIWECNRNNYNQMNSSI